MTPTTIEHVSSALIDFSAFLQGPADQRLVRAVYQILATGHAARPDELATATGLDVGYMEERFAVWPAVFRDASGGVAGFWGLTKNRVSDHRYEVDGAGTAWAWCAYDTLFITRVLGTTAQVTSRCPTTGATVALTVTPDGVADLKPASAVLSLLTPDKPFDDNVIQTLCHYIHFFASPEAAEAWTADHPGTFWVTVDEGFEIGRRVTNVVFGAVVGEHGGVSR